MACDVIKFPQRSESPNEFDFEKHSDVAESNIGWALKPWEWATSKKRRAELDEQTEALAALLEEAGIQSRGESDVVAISAVTGIVTPLVPYRPVRFLPSVANRDRRPMLNALRYWIEQEAEHPEYMRYAVVTAGEPVPAFGDLRGSLQSLARKISKWAHEAREIYDIEVHFRGSEFTRKTAEERGLSGYDPETVLYHPHANILMEPKHKLPKDGPLSWDAFLKWSHDYLDAHWQDCGRVQDVRELVKYVVKPGDLLGGQKPINADETRWLYETLFRLNLAQPMGEFKEFYSDLAKKGVKVVRVKNKNNEGGKLRLVKKATKFDHSEKKQIERDEDEQAEVSHNGKAANIILGVTLPTWSNTPWAEPSILVQNYNPRCVSRRASERLIEIEYERYHARECWDASGAPDPSVALHIAQQWASKEGFNVKPFRRAAGGSFNIYTSSLTVRSETEDCSATGSSSPPENRGQEAPPNDLVIDPDFKIDDFKLPDFRNRKLMA